VSTRLPERNLAMCFNCGHKWLTKFSSVNIPRQAQCPNCWGYAIVLEKQYEDHLKQLRKILSPKEAKKSLKLYDFAVKNGYVNNPKSREVKFLTLLQDLAKT